MAGPQFEVPTLTEYTEVPKIREGAMSHLKSFVAAETAEHDVGVGPGAVGVALLVGEAEEVAGKQEPQDLALAFAGNSGAIFT